jgi:hypothetical protein
VDSVQSVTNETEVYGRAVPADGPAWLADGRNLYEEFSAAAARAGHPAAPTLQLVSEPNAYPLYDYAEEVIRFGLPGGDDLSGLMFWAYYAGLLGMERPVEAMRFGALVLPVVMAHEVAHHLRHRAGTHTGDHFVEEQVAQVIALAWVEQHPVYGTGLGELRSIAGVATRRLRRLAPVDTPLEHSYHLDAGEVLADEHLLPWRELYRAEHLAALHDRTVEEVLVERQMVSAEQLATAELELRDARRQYDDRYMQDLAEYWHFGFAWLHSYFARGGHPSFAQALERYLTPP